MVIFLKKISIISILVLLIDRVLKIIVSTFLPLNKKVSIISNFFSLTYCKNKGAAFSILNNNVLLLIIISIVFIYYLYNMVKKEELNNKKCLIYALLFGGIFGNLFDRIFLGYVIDYMDFKISNYNFAIFNFADMCIVIGAILFIFLKDDKNEKDSSR